MSDDENWQRLSQFDRLPDAALLDAREVGAMANKSRTSIWRDVNAGYLAIPVSVGKRSKRWRVSDVRTYIGARATR